jgi:hypothetical protein
VRSSSISIDNIHGGPGRFASIPSFFAKQVMVLSGTLGYALNTALSVFPANELFHSMFRKTCQCGSLKRGWLNRFMEQHPTLCLQSAQIVKRVRAEASEEGLKAFFWELAKYCIEHKITSNHKFNMDKTEYCQNSRTKKGCTWFKECLEQTGI